ncbi:MAG TPA: glycoside hydrolase family 3 C-terminal domain-containing protein [Candidatus Gallacutalibacter stercoravium]|nr:glycoside hydrolase family 3 C-terminal domain-containing protein [Candidatus Gallacutalibacter stercoravium]
MKQNKDQNKFRQRAEELVSKMTLEEAASQLRYNAPAIERLGIPAYNWWNEALHGVARAGTATVFPQAIAMGASFDDDLLHEVADVIATEGRAKYNMQTARGDREIYKGLTFWSPNINIFRDPRWGRGHETYGEDPYLTSRMGVAFIKGLQGDGEYMKSAACAKHFAVHSGPESIRHEFNAEVSQKDLYETYLPAFEAAVKEAGVEAVMGAYNRTNGEPCCGSKTLLHDILRGEWGFEGHVVSDCGAISDFHLHHKVTKTAPESAALALKNGCDVNCGNVYLHLLQAYQEGLVTEEEIRQAAVRLFTTRMKLGMFDEDCPYDSIPYEENDSPAHNKLALHAARKSLVMLKNNGLLPLCREKIATLGVIGPTADSREVLKANYCGTASQYVTTIEGLRMQAPQTRILYSEGCHLFKETLEGAPGDRLSEAAAVASASDVVVLCLGIDASMEGEEGDANNLYASGDKTDLQLPAVQQQLLETVAAQGKPIVAVVNGGSALDLTRVHELCDAVVYAWYGGAWGGLAVAQALFGDFSPAGRLPVTFYAPSNHLPDFTDYSMKGRTYRYLQEAPLYPFGYGLSYTQFAYHAPVISKQKIQSGEDLELSVEIQNTGSVDSDEVAQLYVRKTDAGSDQPNYSLCGFRRVSIPAGQKVELRLTVKAASLQTVDEQGQKSILPGEYTLFVGGQQPDARSEELTGQKCAMVTFCVCE